MSRYAIGAGIAAGVTAVIGLLVWEATFLNGALLVFLGGGWIVLALAGIGALAWFIWDSATSRAVPVLMVVGAVAAVIAMIMFGGYLQDRQYLAHVQTQPASESPEFAERAALVVARNQARGRITTNGDLGQSAYLPGVDRFTTLVQKEDRLAGYTEVVNQKVALTGQSELENCAFSPAAGKRLDGLFGADLGRQIVWQAGPGVEFSMDDAYGYCDDGVPMVVQPLIVQSGFWPRIFVPAGAAVYNGATGELRIVRGAEVNDIPGPVVSESVARELRESTAAMGSWWEYQMGVSGFADTSADVADPNGENRAEFVLGTGDQTVFVTPLTRRGGSSAIAAIGVAFPDENGGMPSYVVYEFGQGQVRQPNSAVADRIRADFSNLDWAAGLQVFEITPVSTDEWVASIGLKQNVTHRVRLAPDGAACLETAAGAKIRCSGDTPAAPTDPEPGSPQTPVADLAALTDAQLADMADAVQAEVSRRLRANREAGR